MESDSSDMEMELEDPLVCLLPPLPPDVISDFADEAELIPLGHGYELNPAIKLSRDFIMRMAAEEVNVQQLLACMREDPKVQIDF